MPPLTDTRPAAPHQELKAQLAAAIEASRGEIIGLSHRIHADPEPAFEEHHASAWVAEILARAGSQQLVSTSSMRARPAASRARDTAV